MSPSHIPVYVANTLCTVLDAPQLRDDYYCSLLAYSAHAHVLAVGLSTIVFLWSEHSGVRALVPPSTSAAYVTSVAFSSAEGKRDILAIGRANGRWALHGIGDESPRVQDSLPSAIACVAWKPCLTARPSTRHRLGRVLERVEDLLVGDEAGNVWYYSVEWWPDGESMATLLCRISVHNQQICGLAWSPDGEYFASGGNDNYCCLFVTDTVLRERNGANGGFTQVRIVGRVNPQSQSMSNQAIYALPERPQALGLMQAKHRWMHAAAVKAIAFCPWQTEIIATGGGSNDRAIHFYHTWYGNLMAIIDVMAQVTSLLWSSSRRQIAATFGYAQPDHPYRIAVYSWPECQQLVAIPWVSDSRALYAVPYPISLGAMPPSTRTRRGESEPWSEGTYNEGCIVVAASDETIRFHEVWCDGRRGISGRQGVLGGSNILESLAGIDRPGEMTIR